MPSCLVNQCVSKTGRKGENGLVVLHPFPKNLARIRIWLRQTGQTFTDLDALSQKIFDENKRNKYRLCSCHFSPDSYIINMSGRTLRVDAVPSIFPIVGEGERIIEENLRKSRTRKRKRHGATTPYTFPQPMMLPPDHSLNIIVKDEDEFLPSPDTDVDQQPFIQSPPSLLYERIQVKEEETQEDFQLTKIGFCNMGTQTDHTLSNSLVLYTDNQASDGLGGSFTTHSDDKKPKVISRTPKSEELCHTEDEPVVHLVKVKEEPEDESDSEVSTRYWRVESSMYGNRELLLQDQISKGVDQPLYHSQKST